MSPVDRASAKPITRRSFNKATVAATVMANRIWRVVLIAIVLMPMAVSAQSPTEPATTELIAADPADVNSIDAIITASYDVLSGPAGPRDWDRERSLFHPDSRHIPTTRNPSGGSTPHVQSVDDFIEVSGRFFNNSGFYEYEIARQTQRFGDIAHVFSTYAWSQEKDGPVGGRGINSFQLVFDGTRWWIVSVFWSQEDESNPIPAEFLPNEN